MNEEKPEAIKTQTIIVKRKGGVWVDNGAKQVKVVGDKVTKWMPLGNLKIQDSYKINLSEFKKLKEV